VTASTFTVVIVAVVLCLSTARAQNVDSQDEPQPNDYPQQTTACIATGKGDHWSPDEGCYDNGPSWLNYGDKQCMVHLGYGMTCYDNQGRQLPN
jgi:hypothetical protein